MISLIKFLRFWEILHLAIFDQEGFSSDQRLLYDIWFSIYWLLGGKMLGRLNNKCGHSGLPKLTNLLARWSHFGFFAIFIQEGVAQGQNMCIQTCSPWCVLHSGQFSGHWVHIYGHSTFGNVKCSISWKFFWILRCEGQDRFSLLPEFCFIAY